MTTPIIPTTGSSFPASVPLPIDGEAANSLSLRGFVQPFEDGMGAARLLLYGGGIRRRVQGVSTTSIIIQPLGAVLVTVGGVWTTLAHTTSTTINPSTLSGGLAASTRYWVYVSIVTGSLTWVVSLTAPDIGLRYASTSTDLLYVSTFITNSASSLLRYTQSDNNFTYLDSSAPAGSGATGTLLLDTSASAAITTIPYGYVVPAGAATAKLYVQMTGGSGPLHANLAGTGIGNFIQLEAAAGIIGGYVEMSTVLAFSFDYTLSASSGLLSVWCRGFTY